MAQARELPYPGLNFLLDLGTGETETPAAGAMQVQFPDARKLQALSRCTPTH